MALKTFNVNDQLYKKYSNHCKKEGISMSKQIDKFIREELVKIEGNFVPNMGPITPITRKNSLMDNKKDSHSMQKFC